jgi:LmbE family N-acetylglucosaminyl deacetylase
MKINRKGCDPRERPVPVSRPPHGMAVVSGVLVLALALASASGRTAPSAAPPCPPPPTAAAAPTAAEPTCDNGSLTGYDGLLVLAPHPDDETLAFAGLITAYMRAGKPVQVVVVTDGDAYCDACRFWKNGSLGGPPCSALELSNFATPEIDSFAEVRRCESAAAAAVLGRTSPTFLGYPDTGLAAAWLNSRRGALDVRLRRSDFSECADCEHSDAGLGGGPQTALTASSLIASLSRLLAGTPSNTLVATTHWLDGHGDHAGLGNLVKTLNDELPSPRPIAWAVIHAHSPKSTPQPDCWYPGPQALVCPCLDEERAKGDPTWIADLRRHRQDANLPASLPDDAPYGAARQLCLPEEMYRGQAATKLAAVQAYRSQLGSLVRSGELPANLDAIMDCNGYLISFVRRTEAFVLTEPAKAPPSACDPTGVWAGDAGLRTEGAPVEKATLTLERTEGHALAGYLSVAGVKDEQRREVVVGEFDPGCTITVRAPQRAGVVYRGTVSRDGRSMYGSWGGEAPGFFVVHR